MDLGEWPLTRVTHNEERMPTERSDSQHDGATIVRGLLAKFDYSPGVVVFSIGEIDPGVSMEQQRNLEPDMLHIKYPGELVLDIGYTTFTFRPGEFFIVQVVQPDTPEAWESPLMKVRAYDLPQLEWAVAAALAYISQIRMSPPPTPVEGPRA
jgi:hypothetical protein